jgi:acetyl/propionyl-CoA carboxylase alpha subunit
LPDALASARREAKAAFGDDTVYMEKLIENGAPHRNPGAGRHATATSSTWASANARLQRRHQKLIEEAPVCGG